MMVTRSLRDSISKTCSMGVARKLRLTRSSLGAGRAAGAGSAPYSDGAAIRVQAITAAISAWNRFMASPLCLPVCRPLGACRPCPGGQSGAAPGCVSQRRPCPAGQSRAAPGCASQRRPCPAMCPGLVPRRGLLIRRIAPCFSRIRRLSRALPPGGNRRPHRLCGPSSRPRWRSTSVRPPSPPAISVFAWRLPSARRSCPDPASTRVAGRRARGVRTDRAAIFLLAKTKISGGLREPQPSRTKTERGSFSRSGAREGAIKGHLQRQPDLTAFLDGPHGEVRDRRAAPKRALEVQQPLAQEKILALGADLEGDLLERQDLPARSRLDARQREAFARGGVIPLGHERDGQLLLRRRRVQLTDQAIRKLLELRRQPVE